jgi:hypothetical protein
MSKMSRPSILPRSSNLSRPVACSISVGMVPGLAPGPMRSSSVLISRERKARGRLAIVVYDPKILERYCHDTRPDGGSHSGGTFSKPRYSLLTVKPQDLAAAGLGGALGRLDILT